MNDSNNGKMTLYNLMNKTAIKALLLASFVVSVAPVGQAKTIESAIKEKLIPHQALYEINMTATRSGSQVVNISGKMFYEWKQTCDAWTTDHRFNLFYEYADSPGTQVASNFSTYEAFDGKSFNFYSQRKRDGETYEELRGSADITKKGTSKAIFSMPDDITFDLPDGTNFPMTHTVNMIKTAMNGDVIYSAPVFDGSDAEGPIEINAVIGKPVNAMSIVTPRDEINMSLVNTPAWKARMAVYPLNSDAAEADYEMSLVFHENGLISDMEIDYEDFSVSQSLIALKKLENTSCAAKTSKFIYSAPVDENSQKAPVLDKSE